jgi:hypothetical protein
MKVSVSSFRWPLKEGGHEWIRAHIVGLDGKPEGPEQWLLTDNLVKGDARGRAFAPLEGKPSLHVEFANLDDGDSDAIRTFANRYGMLGIGRQTDAKAPDGSDALRQPVEPWAWWRREIAEMRRAISLYDMIRSRDLSRLSGVITWNRGICQYRNVDRSGGQVIEPADDLFRESDLLRPAQTLLNRWINAKLVSRVSAQLRCDPASGKEIIQLEPDTLLAAFWFQFARDVEGNYEYRPCDECHEWYRFGARSTQKFCRDACKSKHYRERKAARKTAKKKR